MKGKIFLLFFAMVFFNFASVEAGHVNCGDTIYTDTVLDSDLLNCPYSGITIGTNDITLDCNGHTIHGAALPPYSYNGIYMDNKQNIEVRNCNVQDFGWGIHLYSSSNNALNNNVASNNTFGIWLESSSNNNVLTNNIASDNAVGIWLTSSSDNILTNNIASNNYAGAGIYLGFSSNNNTLNQNSMSNNTYNFLIAGSSINDFINFIDTTNTVNSRPVYYILNSQDTIYDETTNAGFFACINCNNITVKNLNLFNNSHGILFANTNESSIINNALHSNYYGAALLFSSDSNALTNNIASNNNNGVLLYSSSNNLIYNNYFNNTNNAWDNGANFWNTTKTKETNIVGGPLIGGNFWHDYSGQDTNGDGIGDTNIPYNSNGNITYGGDYFPLVEPVISGRI